MSKLQDFGICAYKSLKKSLKNTGSQAHHIIEKRLAGVLGRKADDMLSVAVTVSEHQALTNAWRKILPYGTDYSTLTRSQIWGYAQEVYLDYPELLDAAYKTIFD